MRFHLTPHELIDTWTGESHGGRTSPLTIDRRHLAPITNAEAEMLMLVLGATTIIYKEKSQ